MRNFALFLSSLALAVPVCAQTPSTSLIASGATVSAPLTTPASKVRMQVRFGSNGPILDDESANVAGNVASKRLEAEPGFYSLQAVSNDKSRSPLGPQVSVQIPGLKREAGRWLFNGSNIITTGENRGLGTPFIAGLRRDKKNKLPFILPTATPLNWSLLELPQVPKSAGDTAGWTTFASQVRAKLTAATGQTFVGFGWTAGWASTSQKDIARQLRQTLDTIAPDAALVLEVPMGAIGGVSKNIDDLAPLCDAVVLQPDFKMTLMGIGNGTGGRKLSDADFEWALKIARRNVEEQTNYDLPVLVSLEKNEGDVSSADLLTWFQGGATGLIFPTDSPLLTSDAVQILQSNTPLFSGAVTLEDVAIAPANELYAPRWSEVLRRSGRVPLLGRLPQSEDDKKPVESVMVRIGPESPPEFLDSLDRAAKRGAEIYVEGYPAQAQWQKWGDITSTIIKAASPTLKPDDVGEGIRQEMTFDDPWFWGSLAGQSTDVRQFVSVSIKQSLAAQAREEKGQAVETKTRSSARLGGDPNAFLICPDGKGRIYWMPHIMDFKGMNTPVSDEYYAAIAGALGSGLISYTSTDGLTTDIQVALRALQSVPGDSDGAASLVSFWNHGYRPITLQIEARGGGQLVWDMASGTAIASNLRGYMTRFSLVIPANSWRYVAIAPSQQVWDSIRSKLNWRAQLK